MRSQKKGEEKNLDGSGLDAGNKRCATGQTNHHLVNDRLYGCRLRCGRKTGQRAAKIACESNGECFGKTSKVSTVARKPPGICVLICASTAVACTAAVKFVNVPRKSPSEEKEYD